MKKFLFLSLLCALPARADIILNPDQPLQIGIGGYARVYTGKAEKYQYNSVLKTQPHVTLKYQATDDTRLSAKVSYRFSRNDRFYENKEAKWYDVYGSVETTGVGKVDFGKTTSVGYNLHQGAPDVSLLAVDDSDLDFFYDAPSGFFAPDLTFLKSDSRDLKINYTSPQINGFTWGITLANGGDEYKSYAPNGIKVKRGQGFVTALQYKNQNDIVNVGLSGGYAYYHDDKFRVSGDIIEANHAEYSLGVNLEKNNYAWGFSYKQLLFQNKIDVHQSDVWSTGVGYDVDKWGVSLNYLHSRTTFISENRYKHIMLSGKYQLNKYVETNISVGRFDFLSEETRDDKSLFGLFTINFKL